jgi:protein SCO1/2
MKRRLLVVLAIAGLAATGCRRRPVPPVLGTVPEFTLTAETGDPFSSRSLAGKVWVADFIFTTCQGPCPRMSSQMRQIQNATTTLPDLRLVSFTVDPERDTPEVLAAYGRRYQANPARWTFLTGPKETLHALSRDAFKLGDVSGELEHSTRFVLVDRKSRIRGYYRTWEKDAIPNLLADIRTVLKEPH